MDFSYSKDSEELRLEFRNWIQENLNEEWVSYGNVTNEETAHIRKEWGKKLFEGGWVAPTWPKEYGGLGLTMEQQLVYLEELVAAGAPEVLNSNVIGVFGPTFIKYGTAEQKERYLPKILSHEEIWCQGFSEPNAGSDLAGLQTKAEKVGDKYILNGQKIWTTYAQYADKCYILVRTDPDAPKHSGISMMLLDMDQPGVEVRPLKNIAGTMEFNEIFLHDAVIPEEDVIGEVNQGWQIANASLANERGTMMAQRSMRLSREVNGLLDGYEKEYETSDPLIEDRLVDAYIDSEVISSVSTRNLLLMDQDELPNHFPAMGKLTWSEQHQEALDLALDIFGQESLLEDNEHSHWIHQLLHSRGETIYAGTSEIQRNIIAKAVGLPSSRGGRK